MIFNRRKLFSYAGISIALPYLESVSFGLEQKSAKKMIIVFSPNGMNMDSWNLKQEAEGSIKELSPTLLSLEKHRNDIIIFKGLAQTKARANGDGGGDHARSMSTFLTGVQIKKTDGSNISAGISADQIAANFFKNQNRIPSLQLGIESGKTAGNCDSGYSCAYSSTISWANPSLPLPVETHPSHIFNRIYGNGQKIDKTKHTNKKSILDFAIDQAERINKQLNAIVVNIPEGTNRINYPKVWRDRFLDVDFFDGYEYLIDADYGWRVIPQDIQEASQLLIQDVVDDNLRYINKYIESFDNDDFKIKFSKNWTSTTGNRVVDRILERYQKSIRVGVF